MLPCRGRFREVPIADELGFGEAPIGSRLGYEIVSGGELTDAGKSGVGRRYVAQAQITIDRRQIRDARHTRPGKHRFDLRAK